MVYRYDGRSSARKGGIRLLAAAGAVCALLAWLVAAVRPVQAADLHILTVNDPPASYQGVRDRAEGFSVEVVREIQNRLGSTAPIQILPERRVVRAAEEQPGVVFFSFSRTPEREARFHWITRLMEKPWVFCFRPGSPAPDPAAMKNLRLGVVLGDIREAYARDNGFTRIEPARNLNLNLRKLLEGRLDCVLTDPQGLAYECKRIGCDPGSFRMAPSGVSSQVYLAISKGTPDAVVQAWRRAAGEMKADGTFAAIAREWSERLKKDYGIASTPTSDALIFSTPSPPFGGSWKGQEAPGASPF